MSKVETLRMAVEYIRSLEKMLALDTSNDSELSSPSYQNNTTFSNLSDTSLPATPPPENQQPFFYALKPHTSGMDTQITIIGGQQYIRIPGTNTFQLVTPEIFENEENIHPSPEYSATTIQIHPPSSSPSLSNSNNLNFVNEINSSTSAINTTETPAGSISPYSGHSSLSPAPTNVVDNIRGNNVIMEDGRISCLMTSHHEPDQKLPFIEQQLMQMQCASNETSHYENIILKQEVIDEDAIFDEESLSNENMIMQWWEQQQNLNQNSSPQS